MRLFAVLPLAIWTAWTSPLPAEPNLAQGRPVGGLIVYPDDQRRQLFYYGPGEIALATDGAGKPDLRFLQARYTGTATAGDQGKISFSSLLAVRVTHSGTGPQSLSAVRTAVGGDAHTELRPLPIQRLEAVLVYAPLTPGAAEPPPTPLPEGHFEEAENAAPAPPASAYWSERTYTLALGPEEAQLFWEALQHGQVALSLGYAFVARGKGAAPEIDLTSNSRLAGELRRRLEDAIGEPKSEGELHEAVVRAGATSLTVDTARWPDLLKRVDINESLPPGYAALSIYCYDFNNALRADLYEKQVEIEARSVTGRSVSMLAAFRSSEPDVYARSLRFPVAVRIDRPYRYRVSEVALDGALRAGPWLESESWSRILDVTRPEPATEVKDDAPP